MKILKFSANWCGPCKSLTETLKSVNLPYEVEEVDIDQNTELVTKYGVRGVPTMIKIDNDENVLISKTGNMTKKEIEELFGE